MVLRATLHGTDVPHRVGTLPRENCQQSWSETLCTELPQALWRSGPLRGCKGLSKILHAPLYTTTTSRGNRLEASLRDNLALSSFSELIAVVVDLAMGHAYIRGNIVVNRPVVIESLIPRLADLTRTPPCQRCFHPHIKCQCGGQVVPASYTPVVTTPPVYATSYTSTQPLPQSAAYGVTPTMGY